jgi:type II secretory pathway pseudopilin PulG
LSALRPISSSPAPHRAGFTLLELLAAIVIIIILAVLLVGVVSRLPGAADRVRCTQNLRSLYIGLNSYTEEKGHWPSQPPFSRDQQATYENWWISELKPYGITESVWQCPGILRLGKIQNSGTSPKVHYSPTMFDSKPGTNKKWPNMPWLIEIASVHGHGPLLILPDGSVHDYDTFLEQFAK